MFYGDNPFANAGGDLATEQRHENRRLLDANNIPYAIDYYINQNNTTNRIKKQNENEESHQTLNVAAGIRYSNNY